MDIDPRAFNVTLKAIATIHTPYESKFGVPRQSGVVNSLESTIVFAPGFRNKDALRGIEGYDYLWLIWSFSEAIRSDWSPTVRPPRLGGNVRRGVLRRALLFGQIPSRFLRCGFCAWRNAASWGACSLLTAPT